LEAEFNQEPKETNGNLLPPYFQTVVAWNHALAYLNRSKLLRNGLEINLNIIYPPPSDDTCRVQFRDLLDEFLPQVNHVEPHDIVRERLAKAFSLPDSTYFPGAVHCEATLMTLIYVCSLEQEDSQEPRSLIRLLKVNLSRFGCDTLSFSIGFQQGCWGWKEVLLVL
jgi:hypothetical protein